MSIAEFCRKLPKIELHTHLLGSMRPATCGEFTARRGVKLPMDAIELFKHINSRPKPDPRYDHTRIPIPAPDSDKSPGPAYSLLDVARWLAEPAPLEMASGSTPRMKAKEVMMIGRKRR